MRDWSLFLPQKSAPAAQSHIFAVSPRNAQPHRPLLPVVGYLLVITELNNHTYESGLGIVRTHPKDRLNNAKTHRILPTPEIP